MNIFLTVAVFFAGLSELATAAPALDPAATILLGMQLEKHTLSDVKARMGEQAVVQRGETAGLEFSLCYSGADGTVVQFLSNGEMGGSEHSLSSFIVAQSEKAAAVRAPNGCRKSELIHSAIPVLGKFSLGTKKADLLSFLGKPERDSSGETVFSFSSMVKKGVVEMDLLQTVKLKFDQKLRLIRAQVFSVTSY